MRLCLLRYPDDSLAAVLLDVDSPAQFRDAKADAVTRFVAAGLDVCRIASWNAQGWPLALDLEDHLSLPAPCAPRVIAGDPGASGFVDALSEATGPLARLLADEMGWAANWPITVTIVTDPEFALARPAQCRATVLAADAVRDGRSGSSVSPEDRCGAQIRLNLTQELRADLPREVMLERARAAFVHEYVHVLLYGLGGTLQMPRWYLEGVADYQTSRYAAGAPALLLYAAQSQQAGTPPRLTDLGWPESWTRLENTAGQAAVYSRAYAAIAYLVERNGLPTVLQPVRANYGGSYDGFLRALSATTGMDLEGLDRAVTAWLTAPGRVLYSEDFANPLSGFPRQASTPSVRLGYEEGEYGIAIATGGQGGYAAGALVPLRDFAVELDARLAPPTDGAVITVDLRRQENGDHYCWQILPGEQAFMLARIEGSSVTPLIEPRRSSAIRPGGEWNHLTAVVQGTEIVLVVNGQEVGRASDPAFREGVANFSVVSATRGAAGARFDNFVVRNPG